MTESNEPRELLPCPNPWCEGPVREGDFSPTVQRRHFGNWQVQCTSCSMDGPIASSPEQAIAAWNHRTATEAATAKEVAELREALRGLIGIQDILDEEGACDSTVIMPRVAFARALLAKHQQGEG